MKIQNDIQVFNLFDTNGRRKDLINALQGYLSILINSNEEWDSLPKSLSQYSFYKKAIELSPDVFKKHKPYDKLQQELDSNPQFKNAIINNDITWIKTHKEEYKSLIKKFDEGIEDRARHYTSTLVKLGFADNKRRVSSIGYLLLGKEKIIKDELESILPLDSTNIIYLRQLLKLRIYDVQGQKFYSPFLFAIYILLKKERISEVEFSEMIQGLNPYFDYEKLETFIENYQQGDILKDKIFTIPSSITNSFIHEEIFKEYFKNKKSSDIGDVYFKFYTLLYDFNEKKTSVALNELLKYYDDNKSKINKAFNFGNNMFDVKDGDIQNPDKFIKRNLKIFGENFNKNLYAQFILSKYLDQTKEYFDTTKRIFKATGIISFDNGYVELVYKELFEKIFNMDKIRAFIYGQDENSNEYEGDIDSYFCSVKTLTEILCYSATEKQEIFELIKEEFGVSDIEQITETVTANRRREFAEFIAEKYPLEKVKELLGLFNNRHNDSQLKEYVSSDATVPTIYEFVVGIAWYYFAGKRIDLLSSYNLTLSANFEPLVHAGGGQGDIVIYENDKVVMLEATLMNSSSQKRGEWEPVLRHSVNLKVEEEINGTQRQVTTFFIADEFDANTINIWKSVAAVPMQSSVDRESYTDNVVIMPINSAELSLLTDKSDKYDQIINDVHGLFEVEKNNFDLNWRNDFIRKIV